MSVDQELLIAALAAIVNGLENTQSALSDHDARLGRTTKQNRSWAEVLELDIRQMRRAKHNLRDILGYPDECDNVIQ